MESKNRLFLAVSITLLISVAIFASFARILIDLDNTSRIVLPQPSPGGEPDSDSPWESETLHWVAVTPETVQGVIASLTRAESYSQEITSQLFWQDGSGATLASVSTDEGWVRVRLRLPSGLVRHELIGPHTAYAWYDGYDLYDTLPTAGRESVDLAQQIPTYEAVLALDTQSITAAEYRLLDGVPVIYVEMRLEELPYLERYWVGVDSGLLLAAETEKEGRVVYRMDTTSLQTPCPTALSFTLPDGTDAFARSNAAAEEA